MARLLAYTLEAFDAIWRNRARSALTMLGMIIGTASVIAVLGIGNAASSGIKGSLDAFGNPGFIVAVDPKQDDPAGASIQYRDVATLLAENPATIEYAFPNFQRTYHIKANGVDYVGAVTSQQDVTFDTLTLHEGRRIDTNDVATAAHVSLLSQALERRLFGNDGRALGQIVRINGSRFRVVGVYDELKAGIFNNAGQSDYIEIPYSTYHGLAPGPIDSLQIFPRKDVSLQGVQRAVDTTLRHVHGPRARYDVQDAIAFLGAFERTIAVVGYGLTAIGGVALVVAGIGIMNIMLVSVTERTREIGIRKAIGATDSSILLTFVGEAATIGALGGLVGIALGLAVVTAIDARSAAGGNLQLFAISPLVGLGAFAFAVALSSVAGFVPALAAARLPPTVALRR